MMLSPRVIYCLSKCNNSNKLDCIKTLKIKRAFGFWPIHPAIYSHKVDFHYGGGAIMHRTCTIWLFIKAKHHFNLQENPNTANYMGGKNNCFDIKI